MSETTYYQINREVIIIIKLTEKRIIMKIIKNY